MHMAVLFRKNNGKALVLCRSNQEYELTWCCWLHLLKWARLSVSRRTVECHAHEHKNTKTCRPHKKTNKQQTNKKRYSLWLAVSSSMEPGSRMCGIKTWRIFDYATTTTYELFSCSAYNLGIATSSVTAYGGLLTCLLQNSYTSLNTKHYRDGGTQTYCNINQAHK